MHFYTIKTRNQKSRTIGIFLKGLVHGFGQKIGQENVFHHFLERKEVLSRL